MLIKNNHNLGDLNYGTFIYRLNNQIYLRLPENEVAHESATTSDNFN